jgi:hypothetical protein
MIAAACEDTDMTTTVQALSDEVRALSVSPEANYQPKEEHEFMLLELAEVDGLLAVLDAESRQLPEDATVVSAVLAARDATRQVEILAEEAGLADDAERDARRAADAAAAEFSQHRDEVLLALLRTSAAAYSR